MLKLCGTADWRRAPLKGELSLRYFPMPSLSPRPIWRSRRRKPHDSGAFPTPFRRTARRFGDGDPPVSFANGSARAAVGSGPSRVTEGTAITLYVLRMKRRTMFCCVVYRALLRRLRSPSFAERRKLSILILTRGFSMLIETLNHFFLYIICVFYFFIMFHFPSTYLRTLRVNQ